MPVSAQEHRVRTGAYNSGRGVFVPHFHTTSNHYHKPVNVKDSTLAFEDLSLLRKRSSTFLKCCTPFIQTALLLYSATSLILRRLYSLSNYSQEYFSLNASFITCLDYVFSVLVLILAISVVASVPMRDIPLLPNNGSPDGSNNVAHTQTRKVPAPECKIPMFSILTLLAGMVLVSLILMSGDIETNPGPTYLNVETHLVPLKEAVWDSRTKWREIGQKLELNIFSIHMKGSSTDGECLCDVLSQWIQTGKATIIDLVRALRSDRVGLGHLAKKLILSEQAQLVIDQESLETFTKRLVCEGDVELIKELVTRKGIPVTEQHLLLACEHQQAAVVNYLLTTHHINPNAKDDDQRTPLSLAKKKDVIKLLIQHGADAENVYALHRKVLNNVFSKDSLKSPVKMFVIGHAGEGKSTLIEAMEHEPTLWTSVVNIFVAPKEVEGVDQRTAGIVPRVFKSRFYGDIVFYDFAGQEAYYSSHAAIIKGTVDTSTPIFLLVIGLHRDDLAIIHSVSYWLGIIVNQCGNMEGKAPLIIVGSHADLVDIVETDRKKQVISQAVEKFISFELITIISIDCRYSNSNGMKLLRRFVKTTCNSLRTKLSVHLNSHMFLIYLLDNYFNELAVTLQELKSRIEDSAKNPSAQFKNVIPFIPTTIPHLTKICVELNDKGHILFLLNESLPEKSFIILDKSALLAEINGTMFAPQDFKQHCQLSTSTGVVPQSKLAEHFSRVNSELLIRLLSYLELAVPIEDQEILNLINVHVHGPHGSNSEKYLFCPALIRLDIPSNVFEHQKECQFHFGWISLFTQADQFFDARFLHVLLLRLAFSFSLAPFGIDPDFPALQRKCSVWKTGISWLTQQRTEVLVEVINKKKVLVLFQSNEVSTEALKLRSAVLQKIIATTNEFHPIAYTEEFIMPPADVVYPLKNPPVLFSLKSFSQSVVNQDQFVVSSSGTQQSENLINFEVYADLGENLLLPFFTEYEPIHYNQISDLFLTAVSCSWSKRSLLANIIISEISEHSGISPKLNCDFESLELALKSWRDRSNGTYKSLRQILDPISLYAGRNPLELAGVQLTEFSEELLKSSLSGLQTVQDLSINSDSSTLLENLKEKTGVRNTQLDKVIADTDLVQLAGCFDKAELYLDKLGLTSSEKRDVRWQCTKDGRVAMAMALELWHKHDPKNATFRNLLKILLDMRREDVALGVSKYLVCIQDAAETESQSIQHDPDSNTGKTLTQGNQFEELSSLRKENKKLKLEIKNLRYKHRALELRCNTLQDNYENSTDSQQSLLKVVSQNQSDHEQQLRQLTTVIQYGFVAAAIALAIELIIILWFNSPAFMPNRISTNYSKDVPQKYDSTLASFELPSVNLPSQKLIIVTQERQSWKVNGFKVHIPHRSLAPYTPSCVLHIDSSISGAFTFPEGHELVSAVYWIYSNPTCNFIKPLTIEIQHCAKKEFTSNLSFVRASSLDSNFTEVSRGHFAEESTYGSLELRSFSGYAVTHDGPVERLYSASLFYLGQAIQSWVVHLVLVWDNEAHSKYVMEYYNYAQKEYFKFIRGSFITIEILEEKVELNITMDGIEVSGWNLVPLTFPMVSRKQVDYYGPGKNLPCYQLKASKKNTPWNNLFHQLSLIGAKKPANIITIDIEPSQFIGHNVEHSGSHSLHAVKRIQDLTNLLSDIGNWEALCTNLGVRRAVMSELIHSTLDVSIKKMRCLKSYFDSGNANWEEVIVAVEGPGIYNKLVAKKIADNFSLNYEALIDKQEL